jgi:hypothetical protein
MFRMLNLLRVNVPHIECSARDDVGQHYLPVPTRALELLEDNRGPSQRKAKETTLARHVKGRHKLKKRGVKRRRRF